MVFSHHYLAADTPTYQSQGPETVTATARASPASGRRAIRPVLICRVISNRVKPCNTKLFVYEYFTWPFVIHDGVDIFQHMTQLHSADSKPGRRLTGGVASELEVSPSMGSRFRRPGPDPMPDSFFRCEIASPTPNAQVQQGPFNSSQ